VQVGVLQGNSAMSQVVNGWEAGTYILTLDAAQRANGNHGGEDFAVEIDGTIVGHVQALAAPTAR